MVDVAEILEHWYAGRPKAVVARSLGVDAKTVRKYVAAAEAAGLAPGGPPVSAERWRAMAREWFPELAGISPRQTSWAEIARHHDRIGELLGVVPVSVIWQRLRDEAGLAASVASVRRYVRAQFPERSREAELEIWRPPSPPGAEALCGIPHRASSPGSAGTSRSTVTCARRTSSGRFAATYRRSDATDTASPRSSRSR